MERNPDSSTASARTMSDAHLVETWKAGDLDAGDELIERHFASVYRFFAGRLREEAAELTQSTFTQLTAHIQALQSAASFRAYLFSIARNVLYSHLRTRMRHGQRFDPVTTSMRAMQTSPSGQLARNDAHAILRDAMARVPLDLHLVLELYYWQSMSFREIAGVLGIPLGTAKSRMSRAVAELRGYVDEVERERMASKRLLAQELERLSENK